MLRSSSQAIQRAGAKNRPNGTGVLPVTRRPRNARINTTVNARDRERGAERAAKPGHGKHARRDGRDDCRTEQRKSGKPAVLRDALLRNAPQHEAARV